MATFPSIRIESGLLGPDIIDQLLAAELPGQKPADFGVDGKRNLTDEIAYVFADVRSQWEIFQHRLEKLPKGDIATSATRDAWMIPFLGLLGYEPRYNQRAYSIDGVNFAISHRAGEPEESPPIHIVGGGQELGRVPLSGKPRMAPHSLVQEYLNRTEILWGLVTNGFVLRLLRNTTLVRRQAYVEFDLQAIIEEKRFEDFAALYRLIHRSRLPRGVSDARDSLLEKYYVYSEEQGGRVRDHLRDGVEQCITRLANGFLSHPANDELRRRVAASSENERITPAELYRQLLRLVYRFLFLLVSEDRGVLGSEPLYRDHYGIARLRRMLEYRAAYTDNDDIWRSLRVLWLVLSDDRQRPSLEGKPMASVLGLPVLNGDLFAPVSLDSLTVNNGDLLEGFYWLAWYKDERTGIRRKVNYAALDVEELGSVYESLIELHPAIDTDSIGRPLFRLLFGAGRKTTGTYYTPPQLVNELVQSALEPVLNERLNNGAHDKQKAILSIRVCDPACGSGHFLLAASRRLGKELARIRTDEDEPAPERVREAIRDVVSHCIYGVDKNPLAVDLCRVALWLESYTEDKPLTFLDHRIRCGDSLIGIFDLQQLKEGIPDKAFEPLEGDDKTTARELAKRNRDERLGQFDLFSWNLQAAISDLTVSSREIDGISNDSPENIRRKKQAFEKSQKNPTWLREKEACDLWTAAFFQWLKPGLSAITSGAILERLAERPIDSRIMEQAISISNQERFFHWPLEYPEVFAEGGFDVVLSNPPWERLKLQEQEFFAARDAEVALAPTKAVRGRLIRELPKSKPALYRDFVEALRTAAAASSLLRHGGRFPLAGRGDINTYAVFAELARKLISSLGRCGIIVPSGIATDDTTKYFFQDLMQSNSLVSLYDFENRKRIFAAIDSRMKFCLLTCKALGNQSSLDRREAEFVFFALEVEDIRRAEKRFTLTTEDIGLLNPNTGTCPIFRSQADAELTKAIYRRVPVLWRENADSTQPNPWRLSFKTLFHMANDSHHFRTEDELRSDDYRREGNIFVGPYDRYLPLYEAKMIHQFDHRWATYESATKAREVVLEEKLDVSFVIQPRYWIREEVVESVLPKYPQPLAIALEIEDQSSIQRILHYWASGHLLNRRKFERANQLLQTARTFEVDRTVSRIHPDINGMQSAAEFEVEFPLAESDVRAIMDQSQSPEKLAQNLIQKFSPKWLWGWRDVTNATNERTLIVSSIPRVAAGHKLMLIFSTLGPHDKLCLQAILNSLAVDYCARQKLGGTSFSYFIIRQLPILSPHMLRSVIDFQKEHTKVEWIANRALELVYASLDLSALAEDCQYHGEPFAWNKDRRFEIRAELDAALFHLYLPCNSDGNWKQAERETTQQLNALKRHFETPRDAVAYILDQFPIMKEKDLKRFRAYKTKERILHIYDEMLAGQHDWVFQTTPNPLPGVV